MLRVSDTLRLLLTVWVMLADVLHVLVGVGDALWTMTVDGRLCATVPPSKKKGYQQPYKKTRENLGVNLYQRDDFVPCAVGNAAKRQRKNHSWTSGTPQPKNATFSGTPDIEVTSRSHGNHHQTPLTHLTEWTANTMVYNNIWALINDPLPQPLHRDTAIPVGQQSHNQRTPDTAAASHRLGAAGRRTVCARGRWRRTVNEAVCQCCSYKIILRRKVSCFNFDYMRPTPPPPNKKKG